jgi:glyoxylase-like metal-dependent hydrolase (beta-lactamase superfamily II)
MLMQFSPLACAAILLLPPASPSAQIRTADPAKRGFADADFPRVVKIAPNVYGYEDFHPGAEKLTTVSLWVVTDAGVVLADGQANPEKTKKLLDAIATTTSRPLTHYILCSDHGDHTGGNAALPAGVAILAHPTSKAQLRQPPFPTDLIEGNRKLLSLGGTDIEILFLGRAHTGGDLSVYLPKQKILFMSEAFLNRVFPAMRSAYPSEWVDVLRKAEKMDVETYVPGHGFVEEARASREELVDYRKALEAVIAEVKRLHAAGVPVDEAIAQAKFGEYETWRLHTSQRPIAVRRIYEELNGTLPRPPDSRLP